jgi:glutathione peroxidase
MSVYQFIVKDAQGKERPLADYQGKVLLIVNTASMCGNTPQYAGLQQMYETWRERGLEILAFPCDQFGHQEPGTDAEIQQFCQMNYGVTFPVFSKIEVNGEQAHPLYRYLTGLEQEQLGGPITWNFAKFLVNRDGEVVGRFATNAKPETFAQEIDRQLSQA